MRTKDTIKLIETQVEELERSLDKLRERRSTLVDLLVALKKQQTKVTQS